ncbi:NAD(P)-dependent oxidoreductase [Actinophytocola sp.]|uniref:NAD(P)-dependent oxidoreductase n=1 Tax=Actinophytocola sp. TaxID=1872138 RepID=UPI002ED19A01
MSVPGHCPIREPRTHWAGGAPIRRPAGALRQNSRPQQVLSDDKVAHMTLIAFIGLGRMGGLMAERLVSHGYQVSVWNRTKSKTEPLVSAGATAADTPADAVAECDFVITMLTGPDAVRDVLFGAGGAASAMRAGAVLIEMSTITPDTVAEIRAGLPAGTGLLDAPVKGSLPAASSGTLQILTGGDEKDVAAAADVLAVLGTVNHVGPSGAGSAAKLLVNIALCSSFVVFGEALALGDRLGLPTEVSLEALSTTVLGGVVPGVRGELDEPDAPTRFSLSLAEKDLGLALAAGCVPDGAVAGARARLAAALAAGYGEKNLASVVRHLRDA